MNRNKRGNLCQKVYIVHTEDNQWKDTWSSYPTCEGIPLEKPRSEWELKLSLSEIEESRFWLCTSHSPSIGFLFRKRSLINERDRIRKRRAYTLKNVIPNRPNFLSLAQEICLPIGWDKVTTLRPDHEDKEH